MPVVHHARLSGWTACGLWGDLVVTQRHDPVLVVTCRTCLRSLGRRPAAHEALYDFMAGMSIAECCQRHGMTEGEFLAAWREACP